MQDFKILKSYENEVFVNSGEVEICQSEGVLIASAIGSCVVVTLYDPYLYIGGMAHVMLPWAATDPNSSSRTKYAEEAVQELMRKMKNHRVNKNRLYLCLIGGGNLLGDGHEDLSTEIVQSLLKIFHRMGIKPVASELGGTQRRSCSLNVASGCVKFTVGDSMQRTLWESQKALIH